MSRILVAIQVVELLEQVIAERGYPRILRSDHGPEFVSTFLLEWAVAKGWRNLHIQPGKPWQNGTNESFNGKFRDECLALNWFTVDKQTTCQSHY